MHGELRSIEFDPGDRSAAKLSGDNLPFKYGRVTYLNYERGTGRIIAHIQRDEFLADQDSWRWKWPRVFRMICWISRAWS
jgi:hypothetical protein